MIHTSMSPLYLSIPRKIANLSPLSLIVPCLHRLHQSLESPDNQLPQLRSLRIKHLLDVLTEDKLRYRPAQSHTHPIRSIRSSHSYQLRHRFLVPPLNQSPLIQEILLAGRRKLHLLLQQPSIFLRIVNSQSFWNIRNFRPFHTAPS